MLLVMSVARPLGQTTQGSRTHNNSQTWICGLAKLAQSGFRFTWDWSGPSLEEHTNLLDRLSLEAKRSLPVLKLMDALGVLRLLQGAVSTNLFGLGCPFYCFLALCVVAVGILWAALRLEFLCSRARPHLQLCPAPRSHGFKPTQVSIQVGGCSVTVFGPFAHCAFARAFEELCWRPASPDCGKPQFVGRSLRRRRLKWRKLHVNSPSEGHGPCARMTAGGSKPCVRYGQDRPEGRRTSNQGQVWVTAARASVLHSCNWSISCLKARDSHLLRQPSAADHQIPAVLYCQRATSSKTALSCACSASALEASLV